MILLKLQFGGIFNGDDALIFGDEAGEHIEQGGFAGAGTARDDDVQARDHAGAHEIGHVLGDRAEFDQLLYAELVLLEFADGDGGAIDGARGG